MKCIEKQMNNINKFIKGILIENINQVYYFINELFGLLLNVFTSRTRYVYFNINTANKWQEKLRSPNIDFNVFHLNIFQDIFFCNSQNQSN